MNVTDDVLNDLLTLYLAGEASADTRALIEERARREPAFAARLEAARRVDLAASLPDAPPKDMELRTLTQTRQAIFLSKLFWAMGLLFSLLPLTIRGGDGGMEFVFLGRHPGVVWAFWGVALASWVAYYVMQREVRRAGL